MIASLDLETSCGVQNCPGYGNSNSSKCEHAVHFKHNKIDIIGVYDGKTYFIFRSVAEFDTWRTKNGIGEFIGHNIKFDYKTLKAKGSGILPRHIVGDTQLLGSVVNRKVTKRFLLAYNKKRKELNEKLPPKQRHRDGKPLSLKTMAPFYLGVDSFWENPISHDDPEYNKKDCIYTYDLHERLVGLAQEDGTLEFYYNHLLPWSKLLAEAEYEGVLIDEQALHQLYADTIKSAKTLEKAVHTFASEAFIAYRKGLVRELEQDSKQRCTDYIKKLKDKTKIQSSKRRYSESLAGKIAGLPLHFNLNSPDQMNFMLGYYGINMEVEKRDKESNEWIKKEGTDKFVLIRAKVRQKAEIAKALLAYRQKQTEANYLKQYIEACVEGRIHCSFNATGTRTGRLSSASPNLQNVKGALRKPFIIADPSKFSIYTVDSSQIEPRLVAYYAQDPEMVKLFVEGRDYHNYATKKFFPLDTKETPEKDVKKKHEHLRKTAKIGDLSIIYGTGHFTFQTMCLVREEMDIPLDRCKEMVSSFRAGMRSTFGWKKNLEESYNSGHLVHTFMGRLVQARDSSSVHMTLFNTLVQGTASDVILHASLLAFRRFCQLGIDAKPLLWVHDEVVWRFPKGKEKFCQETVDYYMKHYKLDTPHGRVPLDVEGKVASCWEK